MLEDFGLIPIDPKIIIAFLGRGVSPVLIKTAEYSIKRNGGNGRLPKLDEAMKIFIKHYGEILLNNTRCYPHVVETLEKLDSIPKAVVTNKPRVFTSPILTGLNLDRFFPMTVCGDTKKKPDPGFVLDCMEEFGIPAQKTLVVGDSHMDLEMGLRAGVKTCFASYGMGSANGYKPDYTINHFSDLLEIVHPGSPWGRISPSP
jgi:phosphoglycolate phosphatase